MVRKGKLQEPPRVYDLRSRSQVSSNIDGEQSQSIPQGSAAGGPKSLQPSQTTMSLPLHNFRGQTRLNAFAEQDTFADDTQDDPEPDTTILQQSETRPISHDQIVVEVQGIYAGLLMVEAKCIDVDEKHSIRAQEDPSKGEPLKNDQWQSLSALHKQLLHEHVDFFLASQHASANFNLSKLAAKYSMPKRMWRHGIQAFLEVLRHRLPHSFEHMVAFIHIAYSMMALLYETASTFEDTWIECLGDLARYRMAIEDDEPKDRELWLGVARSWYSKAAYKDPTIGRRYHHLAILARPYSLEQLYFFTRSLLSEEPFEAAKRTIMSLFKPILDGKEVGYRSFSTEPLIIKAHGLLFIYPERTQEELGDVLDQLKDGSLVNEFIKRTGSGFKRIGVFLAISNIAALFEFGALTSEGEPRSMLRRAFYQYSIDKLPTLTAKENELSKIIVSYASNLAFSIFENILSKENWEQNHILPMVHVMLVFIWCSSSVSGAIEPLEKAIPWTAICSYLNHMAVQPGAWTNAIWEESLPSVEGTTGRPPPEDYVLRGQVYTQKFFSPTWFSKPKVDEEERMLELFSHDAYRNIRILWLAARICSANQWICFDRDSKKFVITGRVIQTSSRIKEDVNEGKVMVEAPILVSTETDSTMLAVSAEESFAEDRIVSPSPSTNTTDTNAGATGTTVRDSPSVPEATIIEEPVEPPEDPDMDDASSGDGNMSIVSRRKIKVEESPWAFKPSMYPVSSPPKKVPEAYSGLDEFQILQGDENPDEGEL